MINISKTSWNQKSEYENFQVVNKYADFKGLRKCELEFVNKYFKKNHIILDIGCGAGRTTVDLIERGFHVIGMDYSSAFLKYLNSNWPQYSWLQADATNLGFKSNTMDISLFSLNGLDCITPLKNRNNALKEMIRVTKKNGYIIYSTRPILHRIFNRFRKKSIYQAVKSNMRDLYTNLSKNKPLCFQGYNLHKTEFEWVNLYMSTTWKINRDNLKNNPNIKLVELIGSSPQKSEWKINFNCHMAYFVYQKTN